MTGQKKAVLVIWVFFMAQCYGYFGWALVAAAVIGAAWYGHRAWQTTIDGVIAERQRIDATRARADVQNAQVAAGDPRGTYGD